MLAPDIILKKLVLLTSHKIVSAYVTGKQVKSLVAIDQHYGKRVILSAPYFIDATILGDLLWIISRVKIIILRNQESMISEEILHLMAQGE